MQFIVIEQTLKNYVPGIWWVLSCYFSFHTLFLTSKLHFKVKKVAVLDPYSEFNENTSLNYNESIIKYRTQPIDQLKSVTLIQRQQNKKKNAPKTLIFGIL